MKENYFTGNKIKNLNDIIVFEEIKHCSFCVNMETNKIFGKNGKKVFCERESKLDVKLSRDERK